FHQAAYFGFGAEVQVRDLDSGNVIYRETLGLADTIPGPHLVVRDDSGNTLLDETLVLTERVQGTYGRLITVPGDGRTVWVGTRQEPSGDWRLLLLEPSRRADAVRLAIPQGGRAQAGGPDGGGLSFEFAGLAPTPASFEPDFPLPPSAAASPGDSGTVLVQMNNVVYGTGDASAGTTVDVPRRQGPPTLTMVGLASQPLSLGPGQSAAIDRYEYTFLGQRDFAGIEVKRDSSVTLVWIATGLLLAGLFISFWVPRRRIWAKITGARTYLASQGGHASGFERETRNLARALGAEPEQRE
ncbi:MAG: cytochrome c biogenesis protein ResB, partial [Dehalococcoidia bacterium]